MGRREKPRTTRMPCKAGRKGKKEDCAYQVVGGGEGASGGLGTYLHTYLGPKDLNLQGRK